MANLMFCNSSIVAKLLQEYIVRKKGKIEGKVVKDSNLFNQKPFSLSSNSTS